MFLPVVNPSIRIPTLATVPVTWLTNTPKLREHAAFTVPAHIASATPNATIHSFGAAKLLLGVGLAAVASFVEGALLQELTSLDFVSPAMFGPSSAVSATGPMVAMQGAGTLEATAMSGGNE
mmetsp:Transcript_47157/g.136244  ORF Transcript_47157/g.136244 Transcript_47157/m.136244 type:complete len:122 (+) Transcript_47157:896-1261(+)